MSTASSDRAGYACTQRNGKPSERVPRARPFLRLPALGSSPKLARIVGLVKFVVNRKEVPYRTLRTITISPCRCSFVLCGLHK